MSSGVRAPLMRIRAAMTTMAIPTTSRPSIFDTSVISLLSGVWSCSVSASMVAMEPICVSMPVCCTSATPTPRTTAVPLNTVLVRSPRGASSATGSGVLWTASDSPVSAAS